MSRPTRVRHTIVGLALLIDLMSYVDRVCISVAAPAMREEFHLSPAQMGLVFSIFSLAYFLFQTPWGMLADRFGARGIVTAAIFWWSTFTALTSAAGSYLWLLVIRFCFGAVEAALSPAIASAFMRWLPVSERATAFGAFLSGGRLGGAVTPYIAARILLRWGWRAMFVSFAAIGVVWAAAWWMWYRNHPREHAHVNADELARIEGGGETHREGTDWTAILGSSRLWCLLAVAFGYTFLWQFYITWFPTYLVERRGLTLTEAAAYAGLPFLFGIAANALGGLITDLLTRRIGVERARTAVGFTALAGASLLMSSGVWMPLARPAAILIALAALSGDVFLGAAWSSAVSIGGRSGGAVAGLMNSASNFGGFCSPWLMGWVFQTWHDWNLVLLMGVATNTAAAFLWLGVNPRTPRIPPSLSPETRADPPGSAA